LSFHQRLGSKAIIDVDAPDLAEYLRLDGERFANREGCCLADAPDVDLHGRRRLDERHGNRGKTNPSHWDLSSFKGLAHEIPNRLVVSVHLPLGDVPAPDDRAPRGRSTPPANPATRRG
jgi:hypothetical protein